MAARDRLAALRVRFLTPISWLFCGSEDSERRLTLCMLSQAQRQQQAAAQADDPQAVEMAGLQTPASPTLAANGNGNGNANTDPMSAFYAEVRALLIVNLPGVHDRIHMHRSPPSKRG